MEKFFVRKSYKMKLLLLSNSSNFGEEYLGFSKSIVKKFLHNSGENIVFIPYAAITFSYDEYEKKVNEAWKEIGIQVKGIHRFENPKEAIKNAEVIVVGGGNTWKLTKMLHENDLIDMVHQKVKQENTPYIGWSAGSNVACPTLKTTNDMPIAEPKSFKTFDLVPFQINPHYLDVNPEHHNGETREYRIQEFITENPNTYVAGLREGTLFRFENNKLFYEGKKSVRIFKFDTETIELNSEDNFDFLMEL